MKEKNNDVITILSVILVFLRNIKMIMIITLGSFAIILIISLKVSPPGRVAAKIIFVSIIIFI